MILALFTLLLIVNIVFAQAQEAAHKELMLAPMNGGTMSDSSFDHEGSTLASTFTIRSDGDSWRKRTHAAAPMFAGDH